MGLWVGKLLGHLATHAISMCELLQCVAIIKDELKPNEGREPSIILTCAFIRISLEQHSDHIYGLIKPGVHRGNYALVIKMDDGRGNSVTPSPLQSFCSTTAVRPCSCIATGRGCLISCYIELGNGIHLSRNSLYNLKTTNFDLLFNFFTPCSASTHPHFPLSEKDTMPRLRHRMRCRRGGTKSYPWRTPSSSNSYSSSPSSEYFVGRYPNTRSGKGRSHSTCFRMKYPTPATLATLASNQP